MAALLGKLFPAFARPASRREELTELLQESVGDKASFDSHEGALLQNFLGLRDLTAADVMIPRADIFAVSSQDSFDDIINQMSAANHSRVPVYRDTLDDVVGIIHIKDPKMMAKGTPEMLSIKFERIHPVVWKIWPNTRVLVNSTLLFTVIL